MTGDARCNFLLRLIGDAERGGEEEWLLGAPPG